MSSFRYLIFQNQVNGILKIHSETSFSTELPHMVQQLQFYHEKKNANKAKVQVRSTGKYKEMIG